MVRALLLILFFIYVYPVEAETLESSSITIDDAVALAIENNPLLKTSGADVDISKALLRQSKSALYPQVKSKIVVPFVGRESGFFLDQLIYDFGRTQNIIRSNKHDLDVSKYGFEAEKNNLVRNTKIKYYQALIAKNNLINSESAIKKYQYLLEKTEELKKAGRKSEIEFTEAKINLEQSRLENLNNQNLYKIILLELSSMMGDVESDDFEIVDDLNYESEILDEKELMDIALSNNSGIKEMEAAKAGLIAIRNARKSEFYPVIFGRTAYRFEGEGADTPAFIAGIGIEFPIFEGFSRFAQVDRAEAEIKKNNAIKEQLKNNLILDIKKLFLELGNLEEKIKVAEKLKNVSMEKLQISQQRFEEKIASKIELTESESSYIKAESDYKNSIYLYKIAKIRLNSFLGE